MSVLKLVQGLLHQQPTKKIQQSKPQAQLPLHVQAPQAGQVQAPVDEGTPNLGGGSIRQMVHPAYGANRALQNATADAQPQPYWNQDLPNQTGVTAWNLHYLADPNAGQRELDQTNSSLWEKMMLAKTPEQVRHELGLDHPTPLTPSGPIKPKNGNAMPFRPRPNGSVVRWK